MGFRFHGGRVFRRYADKSESRTDWLARPLTERQCEYAAADVWYLLPITAKLMVETEASGWLPAALDECRLMQMRRQEVVAPEDARVISPMPGNYAHANWPVCNC